MLPLQPFLLALLAAPQDPVHSPIGGVQPESPGSLCSIVGASHSMAFAPGAFTENFITTTADPDLRRFIVYVPGSYRADHGPYPVVYMLHGTGQNAGTPISKLTWDEEAEAQGFIAVFPEALPYLLLDGTTRTKWHTDNTANNVVDPSELPMADDVIFVRELHNTLYAHLNIDCSRIYASGFSNGGAFVKTKIRVHLADVFAATTNAGGLGVRTTYPTEFWPANGLDFRPHYELVGDKDGNKQDHCVDSGDLNVGDPLPMVIADIQATPCMWEPLTAMAESVGMDSTVFVGKEKPFKTTLAWIVDTQPTGTVPREYRFRILFDLTHEYPSGANYPVDYVPILYAWMNQYTL